MDVELSDDGDFGTDKLADGREKVTVGIRDSFRHHRTVHVEQNAVNVTGRRDGFEQFTHKRVEVTARQRPGRMSDPVKSWDQLEAVRFGPFHETADGPVGTAVLIE